MGCWHLFGLLATLLACHWVHATPYGYMKCRNIVSDPGWPGPQDWARLNKTVDGRLIATVPIAVSCHNPNYHQTECQILKEKWAFSDTQ